MIPLRTTRVSSSLTPSRAGQRAGCLARLLANVSWVISGEEGNYCSIKQFTGSTFTEETPVFCVSWALPLKLLCGWVKAALVAVKRAPYLLFFVKY